MSGSNGSTVLQDFGLLEHFLKCHIPEELMPLVLLWYMPEFIE
jgi:hypothetical protein